MHMKFPKEKKDLIIEKIQHYFYTERSEEIGLLAAENFLDFALKELGPFFYNGAIKDAQQVVEQKLTNLDEDLHSLERPIRD
ncbi:DUF2164 domain-containing protein [Bacillus carboniphilus]|uniref:DUF2164 domain-containing protein n=1 Tax=Bacillus carboniphilus TaxID=86663 RepID=A0ABY9JSP3_9BACI|nr:DUF2164 domain-containing protein [Bacillus carboniphilus]WLR42412.1 DUF2164 domain-containing protein [Bacillus carboniphilus]